jgi:hypothetical protein
MTDILVCTNPDRLLHKQGKLPNDTDHSPTGDYYWTLHGKPKKAEKGGKFYFATEGIVRGYFIIDSVKGSDLLFNSSSWKDVKPIKIKASQGFRYFSYEEKAKEVI